MDNIQEPGNQCLANDPATTSHGPRLLLLEACVCEQTRGETVPSRIRACDGGDSSEIADGHPSQAVMRGFLPTQPRDAYVEDYDGRSDYSACQAGPLQPAGGRSRRHPVWREGE